MSSPSKILVLMLRRIGDVLLTTPAVRALSKAFPKARIDFLCEPPCDQALAGNTRLAKVHVFEIGRGPLSLVRQAGWMRRIRLERYDWVIDFMGNPRSAQVAFASGAALRAGPAHVGHRWAYNRKLEQSDKPQYSALEKMLVLKQLGVKIDERDFLPEYALPEAAAAWAAKAVPERGLVGLVCASRKETRRWPDSSFAALAARLKERHGLTSLVFWGPGEKPLAEKVAAQSGGAARVSPETPGLAEMAALLARCRLVVTNCNGPKHFAVAAGVSTVTIHGSSDPVCWTPPHPRHAAIRKEDLHCIGCRLNECPYGLECMKQLSVEAVADAAETLLAAAGAR